MAHRVGICPSCRSRFQIPATFAHDRARCRNCGGTVEIGPVEGAPQPAAAVAQASAPAATRVQAPGPAPVPAPVIGAVPATPAAPAPDPAPESVPATEPAPRSKLVAILVGALILAVLAIGAWQLLA